MRFQRVVKSEPAKSSAFLTVSACFYSSSNFLVDPNADF